ncbi:MAG TPA: GntG family PLP-dependent aldolase [Candidatus Limnocylindrales bacterium]|nr:GntG family PLP-dependent aldolase [Candidatus Limnocylindrales bacterium]
MPLLDLRSDTVTKPTDEMRRAMAAAEVGDDVWSEDPTVNALEERAAELLGKEAAVLVSSGTMANLSSLMAHVARGQEIIAGRDTHVVLDEAAGHAVVVGASTRQLGERPDGTFDLDELEGAFRDPTDPHQPPTGLVVVENAHSHSMNQPLPLAYLADVASIACAHGVPLHVDGARFFNASVALGVTPSGLAAPADSVAFCLSKGLACPVGSVVVGDRAFIDRARRARKLLGGGMRQAGVIAAAGLIALRDGPRGMIERLAEDHANARDLAERLSEFAGIRSPGGIAQPDDGPLDPDRVRTNFVLFRVSGDRHAFIEALRAEGVLMDEYAHGQVRAVTHNDITAGDVDTIVTAVRTALDTTAGRPAIEPDEARHLQGV